MTTAAPYIRDSQKICERSGHGRNTRFEPDVVIRAVRLQRVRTPRANSGLRSIGVMRQCRAGRLTGHDWGGRPRCFDVGACLGHMGL